MVASAYEVVRRNQSGKRLCVVEPTCDNRPDIGPERSLAGPACPHDAGLRPTGPTSVPYRKILWAAPCRVWSSPTRGDATRKRTTL